MSQALRQFTLTILAALLLLLAGRSIATAQAPDLVTNPASPQDSVVIPLLFHPPLAPWPVIQVAINDQPPLLFMVDTGTNTALVLDEWAATTLKLPFAPMLGYVNGHASRQAYVDKISLSGVGQDGARRKLNFSLMPNIVHVLPLRYMDAGYALSGYGGSRLAGIMGLPLLEFFIARFDFAAKTLTLLDSHRYLLPPARAVTLALERRNALYYLPLRLPNQDASALLFDTGSVFTSLPEAAMTGLRPLAATKKTYRGVDNVVHITDKLLLPNLQFDNYIVPQAVVVMEPKRRSTSLGLDMLARFRVTLDTAHRQLSLEPLPSPGTWLPGWAGLSLKRDNGHYYVATVEARAAMRAGVRVGDRILAVDGMALDDAPRIVAQLALDGAAGTMATLLLQHRNGRQATAVFKRGSEFPPTLNASVGLGLQTADGGPLMVRSVLSGSVAEKAGVLPDDEIMQINDLLINNVSDAQIRENLLKTEIDLKLKRNGGDLLQVKLKTAT